MWNVFRETDSELREQVCKQVAEERTHERGLEIFLHLSRMTDVIQSAEKTYD